MDKERNSIILFIGIILSVLIVVFLINFIIYRTNQPRTLSARVKDAAQYLTPLKAKVSRVINGNTLELETGQTVMMIGVEIPEDEKMRQEAKDYIERFVGRREVRLDFDVVKRDEDGRLLAYVYVVDNVVRHFPDGKGRFEIHEIFLNGHIIRYGYSTPMTVPPNVKHADLFQKLYEEARDEKRGLWGTVEAEDLSSRMIERMKDIEPIEDGRIDGVDGFLDIQIP